MEHLTIIGVAKVAKEEHPHLDHFITCKSVDPIFSTFNASTLEQTNIEYAVLEHGASSSHGPQLDPEERIESQINEWLDEDTWIGAEEEISSDEVIEKDAMDKLSFREKMAYKSYLTSKRQHRESRTKMEIVKNFLKKWATTMSCKDI
ncbi:hypothetical protein Tco_0784497 [Tanacetum coccineum]